MAIAECPVPVLTAIGHEIDNSIADLVAHQRYKTPTAVAESLVDRLDAAAERLDAVQQALVLEVNRLLDEARARADVGPRFIQAVRAATLQNRVRVQGMAGRLLQVTGRRLAGAREDLGAQRVRLKGAALGNIQRASERRTGLAGRLVREAARPVPSATRKIDNLAAQVRLADPVRLLARGYTITQDAEGKTVTRAADLAPGDALVTKFADGEVGSVVQSRKGPKASPSGKVEKRQGPKKIKKGQGALF